MQQQQHRSSRQRLQIRPRQVTSLRISQQVAACFLPASSRIHPEPLLLRMLARSELASCHLASPSDPLPRELQTAAALFCSCLRAAWLLVRDLTHPASPRSHPVSGHWRTVSHLHGELLLLLLLAWSQPQGYRPLVRTADCCVTADDVSFCCLD
jgi:hypothetical protein